MTRLEEETFVRDQAECSEINLEFGGTCKIRSDPFYEYGKHRSQQMSDFSLRFFFEVSSDERILTAETAIVKRYHFLFRKKFIL